MESGENVSILHTVWSAILSGTLGVLFWTGKRALNQIDLKADKDDVQEKFEKVDRDFDVMTNRLDAYHAENTKRLDSILFELTRGRSHGH